MDKPYIAHVKIETATKYFNARLKEPPVYIILGEH